ncbi:Hsp70 family protein [Pseudonocardia sp. RS11V-5]|uniref:Hsp70 family protein n=1 Tax=Pseudonocardia terrae TaxID=2905831 RepID=UPI001E56AE8A|nr:Hsp70 family protein [Pseudonocardia terrae]MCE3553822.1 Hsp70 family protein [Pseudonocardia terrae]
MRRHLGIALDADGLACAPPPVAVPGVLVFGAEGPVVGERALALAAAGAPAFRDFTGRVGDPVPVLADDGTARSGAELIALAVSALAGPGDRHVTLAHPARWGRHELAALRSALGPTQRAVRSFLRHNDFSTVPRPVAAATDALVGGALQRRTRVLVVDVADSATEVTLLADVDDGAARIVATTRTEEVGAATFDRAVLTLVLREVSVDGADRAALRRLADSCRDARRRLVGAPGTVVDVALPAFRGPVRITGDDVDVAVLDAVSDLLGTIREMDEEPFDSVLVTGDAAATPLLHRALSDAFGRPVVVPPEPGAAVARAAAGIAARRAESHRASFPGAPRRRAEAGQSARRPAVADQPVAARVACANDSWPGRTYPAGQNRRPGQPWPTAAERNGPRHGGMPTGAHRRPRRRVGRLVAAGATAVVVALGGGYAVAELGAGGAGPAAAAVTPGHGPR